MLIFTAYIQRVSLIDRLEKMTASHPDTIHVDDFYLYAE